MDEVEFLRARALLLIVGRTVRELPLEDLLKSIESAEMAEGLGPSVCLRGPHGPAEMKALIRGAILFQRSLPERTSDR